MVIVVIGVIIKFDNYIDKMLLVEIFWKDEVIYSFVVVFGELF